MVNKEYVRIVYNSLINFVASESGSVARREEYDLLIRASLSGDELIYLGELLEKPNAERIENEEQLKEAKRTLRKVEGLVRNIQGELPEQIRRALTGE